MKSQVNYVYDFDDDPIDEQKHWLFLENVKLNQQRQLLEEERKKLQQEKENIALERERLDAETKQKEKKLFREKELFEKQWGVVERELVRMANDRERMAKERAYIQREKEELKRMRQSAPSAMTVRNGTFFLGVKSLGSLKKRYRDLMKVYHPDNENGDESTVLFINKEYESLKANFEKR